MIPLKQSVENVETFQRGEYALSVYPTMHAGKVYMESSRVVLIESVNIIGDIQKYILPGQRFSCRPHHLAMIHKIPKQEQRVAGESFHSVLFYENPDEAGRAMGLHFRLGSVYSSGSQDQQQDGS